MNKRELLMAALAAACGLGGRDPARADQLFQLTVAAVHPVSTPWVKVINEQFVPGTAQQVAALGKGWSMAWREFYGGQLYKMNAALTSVSDGIADLGWVLVAAEPSRLPLSQFSAAMPFACGDLRIALAVINELNATIPELAAEWDRQGLMLLGGISTDTYHLFTKAPVRDLADLRGRRISAPGAIGLWLKGSGAVAVDGSLASYYTDIQTGVSDGTISIATGVQPLRIHEVAPHVSLIDMGALFGGGLAINKARFLALPPEVQQILRDAGQRYSTAVADLMARRYDDSLEAIGKTQQPVPVTVHRWSDAERARWARSLPNLAGDWVRAQASPDAARRIVRAYMAGLRQRGARPLRDWDAEI